LDINQRALFPNLTSGLAAFYKITARSDVILFMDTFYPYGYHLSDKDGYLLSIFQGVEANKTKHVSNKIYKMPRILEGYKSFLIFGMPIAH
jgi:hypothetical protein